LYAYLNKWELLPVFNNLEDRFIFRLVVRKVRHLMSCFIYFGRKFSNTTCKLIRVVIVINFHIIWLVIGFSGFGYANFLYTNQFQMNEMKGLLDSKTTFLKLACGNFGGRMKISPLRPLSLAHFFQIIFRIPAFVRKTGCSMFFFLELEKIHYPNSPLAFKMIS